MAVTLIDQVIDCVRTLQRRGADSVWLSPHNLSVLGHRPTLPAAGAKQVTPAVQGISAETAAASRNQVQQGAAVKQEPPTAAKPAPAPSPFTIPFGATATAAPIAPIVTAQSFPPPPDVSNATWDQLSGACAQCSSCGLCASRHNVVFEDGCRTAPLMFIGEGPGVDEDAQGVPFVGAAGQLLTKMIAAMGRSRSESDPAKAVYICNIVKCRPPNNRNPEPVEAAACLGYLKRQIALVRPKVIVLLGAVPLRYLMNLTGITRLRGQWLEYDGIPVMPTFHPSFILRLSNVPTEFITRKKEVWADLQAVMARLAQETASK